MKTGFIQYHVQHDREQNFEIIQRYLSQKSYELVVLPELALCGYLFENQEALKQAAERVPEGESVRRMAELSQKYQCAVVFGMAEMDSGKLYNTAVVVDRGRYVGKYRKLHLSDFEKKYFDRGDSNGVFEVNGMKIGVQICFDLWFPEVSREQIRQGAELLCVLANFGGETTWKISKIRAIENLTPLILCNRVGQETIPGMDAVFLGNSTVIDAQGNSLLAEKQGEEWAACCEMEKRGRMANVICGDFLEEMKIHAGGY